MRNGNTITLFFWLSLVFFFLPLITFSQTTNDYRSANTGNWNNLATWERYNGTTWVTPTAGQGTPTSGVNVITIRSPHVVTVTANVTIDQMTVDAGGQVTVNNGITFTVNNGTGNDLTNNGTFLSNGTLAGGGSFVQGINSLLNIGGASTVTTLTATAAGNTVNYSGAAQTVRATTYVNLTLSGSGIKTFAAATTINGAFDVQSGTNALINANTISVAATGSTTVSGTLTIATTTGNKYFYSDVTINPGGVWNETVNESVTFGSNLTNYGTFTAGTGTHTFSGTAKNIFSSSTLTIPTISVTGTYTNNSTIVASASLTGTGTLTQAINSNLYLGGTTTITNLDANATGNTVYYTSTTANQTIKGTTYYHLTINKTGRTGTLGAATTVNGNLSILAGTLTDNGFQLTGNATGTFTMAAGTRLNLGNATVATSFPTNFTSGNISLSPTSTVNYNSNVAQTISSTPTSYGHLILTASAAVTKTPAGNINVGGNLTIGTNNTLSGGTNTITVAGNVANNGTHSSTGAGRILLTGGSAIHAISGGTSFFGNLELNDAIGATFTGSATTTINGNLSVTNGDLRLNAFTTALYVNGTTTINGSVTFNSTTGTKRFVGLVTVNNGASWLNTINESVNFRGGITNNGTFTGGTGTNTFETNSQNISGTSPLNFGGPLAISGAIVLTNYNTVNVTGALSGSVAGSTWTNEANSTLNAGNAVLTTVGTILNASAAGNTVNYTGGAQTVKNTTTYHNLILSGSNTKTLSASTTFINGNFQIDGTATTTGVVGLTIGGNFTQNGGSFISGPYIHSVAGNWVRNGGTFTPGAGTISLNGNSPQTIGGTVSTTFYNLAINNSSTGVTLSQPVNTTSLALNSGLVYTNSTNLLTVNGTLEGSISAYSASSYVNGPLARTLPASLVNGNYVFPVGKSEFNPVELTNTNTNAGGNSAIRVEVFDANCGGTPGTGMSTLATNRYWEATFVSGSGNFTDTQIRLTESGLDSEDAIGQSTTSNGTYDKISTNPPSGGTITSDAITSLGYFVVGKRPAITIAASQDGTEGGANGEFTLTTSYQFAVDRSINIAITGTAVNGSDYTTINTTFTFPANTSTATLTIPVTDDYSIEPSETVIITLQSGTGYSVGSPSSATVNIYDNDVAGITVNPTSGLTTTEAGGQASFTIVLNTQPTANVTIGLSTSDNTEGTVSPSSITFTNGNWNSAQTVTITGANDFVDDGDVAYTIITAAATSTDGNYIGLDASDVSVTNTDNDAVGITVNPTSGLTTTEAGGQATFTIVLNSQPTADVTIGLSSDDTSEGDVSSSSVTFTDANWSTAQTITVTGANDFMVDGSIAYNIVTAAATSSDGLYNGMNASDVAVNNTDNDVAGFIVNPTTGLQTTEAGGQATFTIELTSQPANDVTISITSDDTSEGTVSPSSVTFTNGDWNSPQTITITGVDGPMADGDITYHIVTGAAVSSDGNYNGLNPSDVTVVNLDNDVAGISINPVAGLITTEAGGTASFTIVLNTQPTNDVTIGISSSDVSEGTVSPSSVTFTDANWNSPQTITLTGVNDDVDDGNIAYTAITAAATSSDPDYNGMNPSDVSVSNTDNDVVGITVSLISGNTTEAGGTATFTIRLNSEPTSDVTIGLSSNDTSEGTVSTTSVTFTSGNWNSNQTITVTGVNDNVDDGNISYSIITAAATSSDGLYNGMNASDVSVSNTDDDTAGITVNPTSGLTTTEAGGQASFTVVLNSEPTANVVIDIVSSDPTEGTVSSATLTFTNVNWSSAQTITITGVNDDVDDGNIAYTILTTVEPGGDALYNVINPSDVSVSNTDNDVAGITVNPTSGLVTTEVGGTATFNVRLNSEPTANVVIGISSNDVSEGTVSPSSLTFTAANWSANQTVTITGVNDFIDDGDIAYSIVTAAATSFDGNYNGMDASNVSVTNTDNDAAGITVNPTSGLTTTEAGGTAQFSVVLTSEPTANVNIGISSSDATEGSVSTSSLTFTNVNWNVAQSVTITGVNDFSIDGNISYTITTAPATSTDGVYNGMNASDVSVTNNDDDVAQIQVSPTSGLSTDETGTTDAFTIELTSIPTGNVTIAISTSDASEGTISPSSIVLNSSNWNVPQTVTITGVNDDVDDDDVAYTITTGVANSPDANYNGINPDDVSVTNADNDDAGITVTPTSGLVTSENLTSDYFTIVLTSQPTANVRINLSVDDNSEGQVSPNSITFTSANWSTAQTITVTGKNDNQNDGDIVYNVETAPATSSDPKYSGMDADNVEVTNLDNDNPGITVSPTSGLSTTEAGGTATFTIVLITQPSDDVTIPISSGNTAEGTVSTSSITFTSGNWDTPQTITITGVNDAVADGNSVYTISIGVASSNDNDYDGFDPTDVSVTNIDLTPTIGSFNPTQVCYGSGTLIVLTGSNFINVTSVSINGLSASYIVNNSTQITATLPATASTGTIIVTTATGTATSSSSLIVDAVSVGGSLTGSTSVCPAINSTILSLSGQTGSVINWQSSPNGSVWTDFSNTNTTYTATNLATTTHYRAVVKNGTCTQAFSSPAVVTVSDIESPTITYNLSHDNYIVAITSSTTATDVAVDFTSFNDGSGPRVINPNATDNCNVQSFTNSFTGNGSGSGNYPLGETILTWTATDYAGHSTTSTQRVYAARENEFALTCPADLNLGCNPSSFPITNPSYSIPGWLSTLIGSGILTMDTTTTTSLGAPSGTECSVTRTRTYTVTFRIRLGANIIATVTRVCTQMYSFVIDTTNPTISCAGNATRTSDSGHCYYTVSGNEFDPTATYDNCGIASVTNNFNGTSSLAGSLLPGGTNTITWTITDVCGNTSSCQIIVTVNYLPVAPTSASTDRNNFCADDAGNINLSVTGGSGSTVRWFTGSCGGTDIGTGSPLTIASPTASTTYYARWENSCGNSTCASVTVTVNPLPINTYTLSDESVCYGFDATINISGSQSGVRYFLRDDTDDSVVLSSLGGGSAFNFPPVSIFNPMTFNVLARNETTLCSIELTDKSVVDMRNFNASAWNVTQFIGTADTATQTPALSADICPQLVQPDFNPNNGSYDPGATYLLFRVDREMSTQDWNFDYNVMGTNLTILNTILTGDVSTPTKTGVTVSAGDNNHVYIRLKVRNLVNTTIAAYFSIASAQEDPPSTGCPDSDHVDDDAAAQTIDPMPAVGPFE